jgi:hypothetical protein
MAFEPSRWLQQVQAEPKILVGSGSIAGLLLLLAKIVEDVIEKESGTFDRTILLAFRLPGHVSQPIGPAWLTLAFHDATSLGSPTIITLITVIAVAYLSVDGRNRLAVLVAISIASGAIAEKLMKLGFDRLRPDIVPHDGPFAEFSERPCNALGNHLSHARCVARTRAIALADQDIHPIHRGFDHPSYWAEPRLSRRPLADRRFGRRDDRIDLGARILARSGETGGLTTPP